MRRTQRHRQPAKAGFVGASVGCNYYRQGHIKQQLRNKRVAQQFVFERSRLGDALRQQDVGHTRGSLLGSFMKVAGSAK